jgi:nicotinamidase-related amidase
MQPDPKMPSPQTALLLIDVQQSFTARPYWQNDNNAQDAAGFLQAVNGLVAGCVTSGVPVLRIFHSDGPKQASNPFAYESGLIRPLDGLAPFEAATTFHKTRHSALVGTGLSVWLREQGIRRLMIAGIRTEQCCETTTRHASDEGFEVDFVGDAMLTFDMTTPAGKPLPSHLIRERTESVLTGRFATLVSVNEALQRAARFT